MNESEHKGLHVSVRFFATAIVAIFAWMIAAYVLAIAILGGVYQREVNEEGNLMNDASAGFSYTQDGIPFVKWLLSPVMVLGANGGGTLIAVIAFLIVIGGVFSCLDRCGMMKYILDKIVHRFAGRRDRLMGVTLLFFMAMGATIGSFEECVPLVPLVTALEVNLGWDALTGMGMSLLAVGCGFASGVCNPFTVGLAQQLAVLPMFSGVWMRVLAFILRYGLLLCFVRMHAKRSKKPISELKKESQFVRVERMERGVICLAAILGTGIAVVLSSGFIRALQDYTMIVVAAAFLAAGVSSCLLTGMSGSRMAQTAWQCVKGILPTVAMIPMASSIKYTLEEARVLDTILHEAVTAAQHMPC